LKGLSAPTKIIFLYAISILHASLLRMQLLNSSLKPEIYITSFYHCKPLLMFIFILNIKIQTLVHITLLPLLLMTLFIFPAYRLSWFLRDKHIRVQSVTHTLVFFTVKLIFTWYKLFLQDRY